VVKTFDSRSLAGVHIQGGQTTYGLLSLSKRFYEGRANGTQLAVSLSGIPERPFSERE
jgi:hypothetical protein